MMSNDLVIREAVYQIIKEFSKQRIDKLKEFPSEVREKILDTIFEENTELLKLVDELPVKHNDEWIPVNVAEPKVNEYILLSFENFPVPSVGRYETRENGGTFYVGDDDKSCNSCGLFVNAWKPIKPYRLDGSI